MTNLLASCSCCQHEFKHRSYKYCPMCDTRRLQVLTNGSLTEEIEVERTIKSHRSRSLPIPTYEQIYVHHPKNLKEEGKLYGKKFLMAYYIDEYYKFLNNQLKAKVWLQEDSLSNQNVQGSRMEWRSTLKAICEARSAEMELLDFGKIKIPWRPKEIYNYLLEHTENLRKCIKNKRTKRIDVSFFE